MPLRALSEPFLNLGAPTTPARFAWVVSAQTFQKSVGAERFASFRDNLTDVIAATAEDLHLATLLLGILGAYFMLRVPAARKYGLFWLTLWLVYTLGRAILGFVHANPDALAYLQLGYASMALFCAFALGVVLSAAQEALPKRRRFWLVLGTTLALVSSLQFVRSAERSSLAGFIDTDVFDDALRRALPARAIVLAHNPDTIFRFWGGEAEERNRPDVTLVPLPLLSYPKLVDELVSKDPELRNLLRDYLLDGELNPSELQTLAAVRPLFVEMDLQITPDRFEMLVPELLYHRVLSAGITEIDESEAMRRHAKLWDDTYTRLGRPIDAQTEIQLLWRHYTDALYFASVGDINAARRSVTAGLALNPLAQELVRMQKALKNAPPDEALDIRPFLTR